MIGEYRAYGKQGDSGKMFYRHFCPTCGGMVFDKGDEMPRVVIVNGALLDDPEMFKPESVIYAKRALSWDHIDPSLPRFDAMPPSG